jgi:plasmid maintenance system antidote protein VapI
MGRFFDLSERFWLNLQVRYALRLRRTVSVIGWTERFINSRAMYPLSGLPKVLDA